MGAHFTVLPIFYELDFGFNNILTYHDFLAVSVHQLSQIRTPIVHQFGDKLR